MQTKQRTPHRVWCEVHRVLAGWVVCDKVAGRELQQPYHVRVLGVEELEAGVGLSVEDRTCRCNDCHEIPSYTHLAYHAGDHGVVEPWFASMQKKHDRPCKEYWY